MDAKLKAKWIEALRSGEYKQTHSYFEDETGFCCLGVLCKVAGKPTLNDGSGNWGFVEEALREPSLPYKISSMNDDGDSFDVIAKYIEANL